MRSSTFRVFRACEEASGGEGFAEDFSLTRDISAAELTHIDHKRKRMPRYFKPLQGTYIMALHMITKLTADRTADSLMRTGQCYIIKCVWIVNCSVI